MAKLTNNDIYQKVTDLILEKLENGIIPWEKPWKSTGFNGDSNRPTNLISKKEYQGINTIMLGCQGYSSKYWMTFKQAKELGGKVKKGEKSTLIVFWKMLQATDKETGEKKIIPLLRYFNVFNLDQTEDINPDKIPAAMSDETTENEFNPIENAQAIIDGWKNKPEINHVEGDRAYYMPKFDKITLPLKSQFKSPEEYYSTAFHELAHSTGHSKRLNRKELTEANYFGSHDYSKEELTAEFASAFLCSTSGIEKTIDNSAAYIKGWSQKLRSNPKWLVSAAAKAQKAANLISLNLSTVV